MPTFLKHNNKIAITQGKAAVINRQGNGLRCPLGSHYVDIPASSFAISQLKFDPLDAWSISCQIFIPDVTALLNGAHIYGTLTTAGGAGGIQMRFQIIGATIYLRGAIIRGSDGTECGRSMNITATLTNGTNHLVVTKTAGSVASASINAYCNKVKATTSTTNTATLTTTAIDYSPPTTVRLFASPSSAAQIIVGCTLFSLKVFNIELTQAQVNQLANSDNTNMNGFIDNRVHAWEFEEKSGITAGDVNGIAHGTLIGYSSPETSLGASNCHVNKRSEPIT
jgi:hypothetical protein